MKKILKSKFFISALVCTIIALLLLGLVFLFTQKFTFIGVMDAFLIAGTIEFLFGWIIFISNHGVFDIVIYGVKQFFMGFAGKKQKKSYLEYTTEKSKVSKHIFISLWAVGGAMIITSLIMYLIYLG
ncbi:DUF3899 domain-containing protein [Acholeplasma sp. OttesenSCG-928-E16]|nr:DUF3899 domain-containing protein [Acholeplasma sp. OttesenSCG-928-E16]